MALREKQIQQNYRPIIAVHKWFARRLADPFMGGGTPLIEANRLPTHDQPSRD